MPDPDLTPAGRARLRVAHHEALSPAGARQRASVMAAFPAALDLIDRLEAALRRVEGHGGDWVDCLERLEAENVRLKREEDTVRLIERLRTIGGVGLCADRPAADGVNSKIYVWDNPEGDPDWFYGTTLLDCLRRAAEAKKGAGP